jgi:hypothetical protein
VLGSPLTPEPVLGGRRIARLPQEVAPEALDFTRLIRAGETVGWAEATAEPVFLTRLLDAQAARCAPFRVFFPLTFSNTLGAGHFRRRDGSGFWRPMALSRPRWPSPSPPDDPRRPQCPDHRATVRPGDHRSRQ